LLALALKLRSLILPLFRFLQQSLVIRLRLSKLPPQNFEPLFCSYIGLLKLSEGI
jgi:hypothetical protein